MKDTIRFARIIKSGYHDIFCTIANDAVGTDHLVSLRVAARPSRFNDWEQVEPLLTPTEARQLAAALVALADEIAREQEER